ncbi:MAG: bifunctional demethylmenaquinone methyltransferase/2-methoxy-6-polyprenyl-1,4-benzoquinol methylase UbiE [Chthonomonadales bacterium]
MAAQNASPVPYSREHPDTVRSMFAAIARRYDLLNTLLSFNRHKAWRRYAVRAAGLRPGQSALDVCTGTGDFAVELFRAVGSSGLVVGADFCRPMIVQGMPKVRKASGGRIRMMLADGLRLPYKADSFHCATVGFGIRNMADAALALQEMTRVVRPGGCVVCLEFSRPTNPIVRRISDIYQMRILPMIGGLLSRRDAYTYLPRSIQTFYSREEMASLMRSAGLEDVRVHNLNLGTVCVHIGTKR